LLLTCSTGFDFKAWLHSQTGESGKPGDDKNAQQHPNGSPPRPLSGVLRIQPLACWPHCPYTAKTEATAAEKGWHRNYAKADNGCRDAPSFDERAVVLLPALFTRSCRFH